MAAKPRDQWSDAYRRRVESAERRGKTRAEARGHRDESAEKKRRRAQYHQEFGASPEKMGRLRRLARAHMRAEYGTGSKGRVDFETIEAGIRLMTAEMIQDFVLQATGDQLRALAALSYQALILEYPELENDAERNPFWYHPG